MGRQRSIVALCALWAMVVGGLGVAGPAGAQPALNTLSAEEAGQGWALLFDGSTLDGWTTPGAAWTVKDGEIVTPQASGWWLRTTRMYRDFELKLDFLLTPGANSGVGLRGSSTGDPAFTGMEIQILDTFGQEPKLGSCGAVYNAIVPSSSAVRAPGEWNSYHIRLVGDELTVTLNGVVIHDKQKLDQRGIFRTPEQPMPLADRLPTGYIALQEHGKEVRFRNIKVRDLSPDPDAGGFEAIFNGANVEGWTARGGTNWVVEDGALVGIDGPGHLFSPKAYTDLEMRAFVRVNTRGNSGFYFRTVPNAANPDTWPTGYEAQVDQHDPKNFTGCIYDRAWPAAQGGPITRDNAWIDYRVRAVGDHIQTWINGVRMVDAKLSDFASGHVVLQGHHKGNRVEWRDIQVRDLSGGVRPRARALGEPVRVVYTTHSAGFRHDVLPLTREIMAGLGADLAWLDVRVEEDVAAITPEVLAATDVVMLYTTGSLPMGQMRDRMMEWVRAGGALVGVHSATDTYADVPAYIAMIGGSFDGHPWNEEVRIRIDDASSPMVAPFLSSRSSSTFQIADEIYQFHTLAGDRRVLMSLDAGNPKMEPGREYPLAWTRDEGRGRVFYSALGHRPEVWRDPRFIGHLLAGIRWAARAEAEMTPATEAQQ